MHVSFCLFCACLFLSVCYVHVSFCLFCAFLFLSACSVYVSFCLFVLWNSLSVLCISLFVCSVYASFCLSVQCMPLFVCLFCVCLFLSFCIRVFLSQYASLTLFVFLKYLEVTLCSWQDVEIRLYSLLLRVHQATIYLSAPFFFSLSQSVYLTIHQCLHSVCPAVSV